MGAHTSFLQSSNNLNFVCSMTRPNVPVEGICYRCPVSRRLNSKACGPLSHLDGVEPHYFKIVAAIGAVLFVKLLVGRRTLGIVTFSVNRLR